MSATATIDASACRLVLVDYQVRLMPAIHEQTTVLREALLLADVARLLDIPVLGTEQNPDGLGPNLPNLRQRCDQTLAKTHFDACRDGLLGLLGDARQVVIAGCEAHVCLLQTALGLLRHGCGVWVVAPACGSRATDDKELAMQRLRDAGATVVSTEMALFEWLGGCRHPRFKDVLARLKQR